MRMPVLDLALAGLTLELSRPAQGEPVLLGAMKRARLERIVRLTERDPFHWKATNSIQN